MTNLEIVLLQNQAMIMLALAVIQSDKEMADILMARSKEIKIILSEYTVSKDI